MSASAKPWSETSQETRSLSPRRRSRVSPHDVRSLPSKPVAHVAQANTRTIIARSDSNGEDLEGFAGAGLYDSVVVDEPELKPVAYADEPLIWDAEKRSAMIRKLAELAVAIEVEMKSPQDIEGCIVGETFTSSSRDHRFSTSLTSEAERRRRLWREGERGGIQLFGASRRRSCV